MLNNYKNNLEKNNLKIKSDIDSDILNITNTSSLFSNNNLSSDTENMNKFGSSINKKILIWKI